MTLNERVAVVTGGARGIGREIVRGFLAENATVAALDLSWPDDDFTAELKSRDNVRMLTADVTDEEQLERAFRSTIEAFGTVDVLVNNAALLMRLVWLTGTTTLDSEIAQWERFFAINTLGPLKVTRVFIKPMIEKRHGNIVMISSNSGAKGRPGDQPYGATKAALTNYSQSLADELRPANVAVNIVFPPSSRTSGYEAQLRARLERGDAVPIPGRNAARPGATVPVVLHLADVDPAEHTGEIHNAMQWNQEHGLGGPEVWAASAD